VVAELVDALVSGTSARKGVEVQVLSTAPKCVSNDRLLAHFFMCLSNSRQARNQKRDDLQYAIMAIDKNIDKLGNK
jgi:hypothetical protein